MYSPFKEMCLDGDLSWGLIKIYDEFREADVLILHPDDHPTDGGREDIEVTLVHELLHIYSTPMRGSDRDPGRGVLEEQMLNAIADALVNRRKAC